MCAQGWQNWQANPAGLVPNPEEVGLVGNLAN